jgi:glycosyltransferase involved in cell wall biosynthesis
MAEGNPRVAVIVPCLNEEATIGRVVREFRQVLPQATVVVIDNNCTDATARVAAEAGAQVLRETRPGKGHATRKAFREVDADVYLLVDGDDTYPARDAPRMLEPILRGEADVVVGARLAAETGFRWVNRLGNVLLLWTLNFVFRASVTDLLSGYRAMTREFVTQAPVLSAGFELETELSVLAFEREFRTVEIPVILRDRPEGSRSKIRVVRDGLRILATILTLLRDYRPLSFFGSAGVLSILLGLIPGTIVTVEFFRFGTVRIPTAVLATGMVLSGLLLILVGVILVALNRRFRELDHRLNLLADQAKRGRGSV